MKYVAIYYIIYTIVYCYFGGGDRYWGVYNMLSILIPFSYFMYRLTYRYTPNPDAVEWIKVCFIMTVIRCIYTTSMPFAPVLWVYDTSKYLAIIFALWMIIKIAPRLTTKLTGFLNQR